MKIPQYIVVAGYLLVCHATQTIAAGPYHITDLGSLNGGDGGSVAEAINNAGQVVGHSSNGASDDAFLWSLATGMIDLGTLPGGNTSTAYGINDIGQVVGVSATGANEYHAFLWTSGNGMQDLGTLPGGNQSNAYGINSSGKIVGESVVAGGGRHAFLWSAGSGMEDLGDLSGGADESQAFAINDSGQIAGYGSTAAGRRAVVWASDGAMQELGTVSATSAYSFAFGINSSGQVVGHGDNATSFRQFIWSSNGGMQDIGEGPAALFLPPIPSAGINASGEIVSRTAHITIPAPNIINVSDHATVWTSGAGLQDLNGLLDGSGVGWELLSAFSVNDAGQIVGFGISPNGHAHGYVLTPVPEPATLVLFLGGILTLYSRRFAKAA